MVDPGTAWYAALAFYAIMVTVTMLGGGLLGWWIRGHLLEKNLESCAFCGDWLRWSNGCWVDITGGDCCSGDDELNNENGVHVPAEWSDWGTK